MAVGAELHYFGMRLKTERFFDPIFYKKQVSMVRENHFKWGRFVTP
jgi:hypothetical protein